MSTDYIAVLDLETNSYKRVKLVGLPAEATGIYVHAIDAVKGSDGKKTVMINSHRPPKNRALGKTLGANSVIEIFETTGNDYELKHVKTVSHPLIRTPNNLVATGPRTFFVTNDHRHKVHWVSTRIFGTFALVVHGSRLTSPVTLQSRAFEMLKSVPSDIIYCDATKGTPVCKVAADGLVYPNGIAKGPRNLLYQGSTLQGLVRIWEENTDHTLKALAEVPVSSPKLGAHLRETIETEFARGNRQLERPVDNIHVDEDGSIYATALTKVLDFMAAGKEGGLTGSPAVEIMRITNDTTSGKYRAEIAFADDGSIVSASTTAAPYRGKLVLTGELLGVLPLLPGFDRSGR